MHCYSKPGRQSHEKFNDINAKYTQRKCCPNLSPFPYIGASTVAEMLLYGSTNPKMHQNTSSPLFGQLTTETHPTEAPLAQGHQLRPQHHQRSSITGSGPFPTSSSSVPSHYKHCPWSSLRKNARAHACNGVIVIAHLMYNSKCKVDLKRSPVLT